jgi:hypothetical protein
MNLAGMLNSVGGNPREGRRYREDVSHGRTIHDYGHGERIDVGPEGSPGSGQIVGAGPAAGQVGQSLGDYFRGGVAHGQQHPGDEGTLIGHLQSMGSAGGGEAVQTQRGAGMKITLGNRVFHIYYTPSGQREVFEIKHHPQPVE